MAGVPRRKANTWTYPDGACTSCRNRKIKCGREKPRCSSCYKDGHECIYSLPPKRVNHIKVLCQNFDNIHQRLDMIQKELSQLRIRSSSPSQIVNHVVQKNHQIPQHEVIAGHIIRDTDGHTERYHGPWSLVAQYRRFEESLGQFSEMKDCGLKGLFQKLQQDSIGSHDLISYSEATHVVQSDMRISLPPRQFLSIVLESFLANPDYASDIFSRQSVYSAMNRVYEKPPCRDTEAWILCFNLIVLLSLGKDQPLDCGDSFLQPMLQSIYGGMRNLTLLRAPRLVNIQALALLATFCEQCYPGDEALGNFYMTQACFLARQAGLQQNSHGRIATYCPSLAEKEERRKVYQSLYIRDRYYMTASGSLGSLEGGLTLTIDDSNYCAHWELANIQDKVHCAVKCAETSPDECVNMLRHLHQELQLWQQQYNVPSSTQPTTVNAIVLHLQFLGTRMHIAMANRDIFTYPVLCDARLACLLIVLSCAEDEDLVMKNQLQELLGILSTPVQTRDTAFMELPSLSSPFSSPAFHPASKLPEQQTGSRTPIPLHRLIKNFPITAVFAIARNAVGTVRCTADRQNIQTDVEGDTNLLQQLLSCFQNCVPFVRTEDKSGLHSHKLENVLERFIQVLCAVRQYDEPNRTVIGHGTEDQASELSLSGDPVPPVSGTFQGSGQTMDAAGMWSWENSVSPSHTGFPTPVFRPNWATDLPTLDSPSNFIVTPGGVFYNSSTDPTPIYPNTPTDGTWLSDRTDAREWDMEVFKV